MRPHLASLYAQSHALAQAKRALASGHSPAGPASERIADLATLTPREREVLGWVAAGFVDRRAVVRVP